jgi:hypothetical protein
MKVRIKKLPQARTGYQVKGGLVNDVPSMGGADYNAYIGQPNPSVKKTMTAVPREEANLEAEGGETVIGNIDGSGMPSFYDIKGPRHTNGGVPLSLPDDSFIFSDTKSMIIKDPSILKMFNVSPKKGYTPAELSKKYDINKYRALLQDPNSDKLTRKTAEMMIKNAVMKLGALALAQESKKGFPQGIPEMAKPYMEAMGISEEELIPQEKQQQPNMAQQMPEEQEAPQQMPDGQPIAQPQEMMEQEEMMAPPMAMYGMSMGGYDMPFYNDPNEMAYGGQLPQAKDGRPVNTKKVGKEDYGKSTWETRKDDKGEYKYNKTAGAQRQAANKAVSGSGNGNFNKKAWEGSICDMIKKGATYEQLTDPEAAFKATGSRTTHMAPGPSSKAIFDKCNTADVQEKFAEKEEAIETDPVIEVDEETGEVEQKCYCPDENGNEVEKPMVNGKCECEKTVTENVQGAIEQPYENDEGWYPQDVNNLYGALGTMWSRRKGQPWSPRVDLEEPRPRYIDPTRGLAAQSEQANIASQAAAQYAGPQALNARLAAIQGQGAQQAADLLSNTNNQNVNIFDNFEGQQVGIRNQESLLNQQLADKEYDEVELANQNFANTRLADKAQALNLYNTGITNEANRLNMNEMYPDYGINRKGRLKATPTMKTPNPEAESQEAIDYALQLKGSKLSDVMQKELFNRKFPKAKKGGATKKAGYVYADMMYPFIF